MWNCKTLSLPPYCEIKTSLKPADKGCLLEARKCLKKSDGPVNDHMKLLTAEVYITKRIIYKLSNQFRSDKALKTLKQVHTCMKRLDALNIEKQLADSIQLVDRVSGGADTDYFLPSRQVLEYQLVTLQGAGALLRQTVQYCQKTFIHVRQHLELGNMIPQNLIMLALTSRIWYVCNSLGLYVCKWYGKLYSCLTIFKSTAVPWLQNEELPEDLSAWLAQLFTEEAVSERELMSSVEAEKISGALPPTVEFLEAADQEDIGEPIQRKQFVGEPAGLPDSEASGTEKVGSSVGKRKLGMDTVENEVKQTAVKKKQKVSVSAKKTGFEPNTEKKEPVMKSDTDLGNQSKHMANEKVKKQEQLTTNLTDVDTVDSGLTVKLPDVNIASIQSVKAHLETILHTHDDVDNLVKQIKSGTFQICGTCFRFSKSGKKKIMKNIDKWKTLTKDKSPSWKTEKLFLKKVKGPLSELLVKHNQTREGSKEKLELKSAQKLDVKNEEVNSLLKDSEVKVSEAESLDLKETSIGQETFEQESSVKKRRKKKKNKMKTEINSSVMIDTKCPIKLENKIHTAVKTSPSKKRKKKSKRK